MLKKTLTYQDFNGEEVSEDYFFHLSKAELVELELSHKGGLSESLQKIVASEDGKAIIAEFKNIILLAYGQRSEDGKRFIKNQQLREEFESSEAYSTLFMELVLNTDSAIEFINGVVPKDMSEEMAKLSSVELRSVEESVEVLPKAEPTIYTRAQLEAMPIEEMADLRARVVSGEVIIKE